MKRFDVTIDGIKYHVINVLNKQDNRIIIRTKATSGQVFQIDYQNIHHISFQNGEETVTVNALLKSMSNNTKINEIEFGVVTE